MTFSFDGGDILVLLAVLIALFLFRRFDKTSRSLEKVRRYTNKVKRELDSISKKEELKLKDLAVDFGVQEKTNKAILTRAEAVRNEIISRTDALEERVKRIEAQEHALNELNDLAFRVDENLSRLRDESVYVDKVGARLTDIREKFSSLEEKDEARFAGFRNEVLAGFQADLSRLSSSIGETDRQLMLYRETLENLNAGQDETMRAKKEQFQDDLEQVEANFRGRLEKVAEEGARLEDAAFAALNERIDSQTARSEDNWRNGLNTLKEEISSTASSIQDELAETRREMDAAENRYQVLEERLQSSSDEVSNSLEELEKRLDSNASNFDARLKERLKSASASFNDELKSLAERQEAAAAELDSSLSERIQSASAKISADMEELEKNRQSASASFNDELKSLAERQEAAMAKLDSSLSDRIQSASAKISVDMEELERNRQSASASFGDELRNLAERQEAAVADIESSLSDRIQSASAKTSVEMKELEKNRQSASASFGDELRNLVERQEAAVADIESSLNDRIQSVFAKTSAEMEELEKNRQFASASFGDELKNLAEQQRTAVEELEKNRQSAAASFNDKLKNLAEQQEASVADLESSLNERIQSASAKTSGEMEKLEKNRQSASVRLSDELRNLAERQEAAVAELESSLNGRIQSASAKTSAEMEELEKNRQSAAASFSDELKSLAERQEAAVGDLESSLSDRIQSASAKTSAEMEEFEKNRQSASVRLSDELRNLAERQKAAVAELDSSLNNRIQSASAKALAEMEELEKNRQSASVGFDASLKNLEERIQSETAALDSSLEELRARVLQFMDSKETNLLEGIETRQSEYSKDIEKRFEQIEGFISDMDVLAESLRSSQKQTLNDAEAVFQQFDSEMRERRESESADIEEETSRVRQKMMDLEHGLEELKAKAYDNVSEKLQVFEDGFFADIRSRGEQMKIALDEWRKNADLELAELGLQAGRERAATERRYSAELKQEFSDLQSRVLSQCEEYQNQVDGFRDSLTGQIFASEKEFASFRQALSARIAEEKEAAFGEFKKAFGIFGGEAEEKFAKSEKIITQKFSDFSQEMNVWREELTGEFHRIRDDAADWMKRLDTQMSESERGTADRVETMEFDFSSKMSDIQEEYAGRTEQLILESGEERGMLRREIAELRESVNILTSELSEKSREALSALSDRGESFLLEFRRNSREARDEVERKVKELRHSVQDSRNKADAHRGEMIAHIDSEYSRLLDNLDEIDKRQKEFVAETRVFERADELKVNLESDIAELGRQLDSVSVGREKIQGISSEYERAVSLYEEVSGKMSRFLAEQQKVDNLEGKIARIGSLSESVDLKLDRMNDANDTLQDFQVRLKQLEDLHEDLAKRYERLSDQSTVLDTATEGVDKNFQRMLQIEELIKDLGEHLVPLRAAIEKAEAHQVQLEESSERIDAVAGKVAALDSTLQDVDRRLEELGKAREWLAKAETRLEEINTEAKQHLRLLGTLSKQDNRAMPGSPAMSIREIVVKLTRQGWNSTEISQYTKLSRSEVELILELMPHDE